MSRIQADRAREPTLDQTPGRKERAIALIRLGRPFILIAGILSYGLGVCMGYDASGTLRWDAAIAGFLVFVTANLSVHYADEYADLDTDSLTQRTRFSGGSGVLPSGILAPVWALRMAIALAIGSMLLAVGSVAAELLPWHSLWVAGLGLFGGWFYCMPPLALERRGLGEIDNALLGGILIPLFGYVAQTGSPTPQALLALSPIFAIVMVNLLGVHWADRAADAAVGKRSLAVIAGRRAVPLHRGLTAFAYLSTVVLTGSILPPPVGLAMLATAPISLWATATFTRRERDSASSAAMVAMVVAAAVGWIIAAQ